jgi:hypothetical protein
VREEEPRTAASAPVEEPSEAAVLRIVLLPLPRLLPVPSRDGGPAAHAKTPVAPVGPRCVVYGRRHR